MSVVGSVSIYDMLAELPEDAAVGRLALIYDEIKLLSAIPYVSSMQRHLATRPGWLEWAWDAVAPAFRSHVAQSAAWEAADNVEIDLGFVPRLSEERLKALRVGPADAAAIKNVCAAFIRVSPVNLMFSGLVREQLRPTSNGSETWDGIPSKLPKMLLPLPAMADSTALDGATASVLREAFEVEILGERFVPGLYRLLVRWPQFVRYIAEELAPTFAEAAVTDACDSLLADIDAAVPAVSGTLPARLPPPDETVISDVIQAIERYRVTSPQMVIYSQIIEAALTGL